MRRGHQNLNDVRILDESVKTGRQSQERDKEHKSVSHSFQSENSLGTRKPRILSKRKQLAINPYSRKERQSDCFRVGNEEKETRDESCDFKRRQLRRKWREKRSRQGDDDCDDERMRIP